MTSFLQNIKNWFPKLKENFFSGLTVAFISVPLSIALAIASGGTPTMGIITGVWATAFAAMFGGSNYNVIGVAGALTTVIFSAVAQFSGVDPAITLAALGILTGVFVLVIYVLKLDKYLKYIPASIMYGFATGVAFLIAAGQLFDALGLSVKKGAEFIHNMKLVIENISTTHIPTLIVFVVFLAFLLLWKKFVKKLPGVIPATVLGVVVGYVLPLVSPTSGIIRLVDKFGNLSPTLVKIPDITQFGLLFSDGHALGFLIKTALLVTLIAVLETLITAKIGDRMTGDECDPKQELFGLGVANIVSGFFGGLPSTGVFIRTGANIKAGATHKASQLVAAIATAVIALVVMPLFKFIPMAVIAAILFNTAIGLIEVHAFKQYWREERTSFWLAMLVTLITILEDAGVAVIVGAVIGVFVLVHRLSQDMVTVWFNDGGKLIGSRRGKEVVDTNNCPHCDTMVYSIAGFLNYLDIGHHIQNIKGLVESTGSKHLVIRMRDVYQVDLESIEALAPFIKSLEEKGVTVDISSAHDSVLETLNKDPYFKDMAEHGHIFEKTSVALEHK